MLFGHESRLMLTETVGAWKKLAGQSRQKLRHERKTMFLLAGHNTRLGSSMTFGAWRQAVTDGNRERSVAGAKQEMAEQAAQHKNRLDETKRKYFMLMDS